MSADTILVTVGEEDRNRTDEIASVVIDVAAPADATVVLVHVLTEETYQRAVSQTEAASEGSLEWVKRWSGTEPAAQPGIEGDVPEWIRKWSESGDEEDATDSPSSEVVETVLERKALIRELATAFEAAGVDYEIRGDVGDPIERVLAAVEDADPDFVVVGGRNRSPARQALFGSVSQEILRSVDRPVISIREPGRS